MPKILTNIGKNTSEGPLKTDAEYRKEGAIVVAKRVGKLAATGAAAAVLYVGGNYALNNAETINRDLDQEHIDNFGTPRESDNSAPAPAEFNPSELPTVAVETKQQYTHVVS
jgi:hypothetical protein